MLRRLGLALCVFGLAVAGPAVAYAQAPGQGPPMPIATDLGKVPVGSWAEYSMVMGQMAPMKMRMALVAKSPAGTAVSYTHLTLPTKA